MSSLVLKLPNYNILYYCEHCKKFYTIVGVKELAIFGKDNLGFQTIKYNFITDFGDNIYLNLNSGKIECPNCKSLNNDEIVIEPWIREMFFKIKGN